MKVILLMMCLMTIGNTWAEDKIKNAEVAAIDKSPCAKNVESPACKSFIQKINKDFPCASDIGKYCAPKDISNSELSKNININEMNQCLQKNLSKLSHNCQNSLETKQAKNNCIEMAMAKCTGLKADKQIDCMAEEQPQALNDCKAKYGN